MSRSKSSFRAPLLAAMLVSWVAPATASAQVTLNFDSLNTSGGAVTGAPLTSYLAGYGITITNITPGGGYHLVDNSVSVSWLTPVSAPNYFWFNPTSNAPFSYRINFATPLTSFQFSRIAYVALASEWDARALDSGGATLSTVSEPMQSSSSATTFVLTGSAISSVVFERLTTNFSAGLNNPPMDNWVLTAVPEPTSFVLLGIGTAGLAAVRRRFRTSAAQKTE